MSKTGVVIILLMIAIPSMLMGAITGKVVGKVTAKDTGEPLAGVNVIIEGTMFGAATNISGEFLILNVPPGTHALKATYMGYKQMIVQNVRVSTDLTTTVDFSLEPTVLDIGETVTVIAERPLVQKDMTGSRSVTTNDEMDAMSIDAFEDVVAMTAGIVLDEENQIHIRGGRGREVAYLLDNSTNIMDPMGGNLDADIPELAIEETTTMTGGFTAEYGNAQSGIVKVVTKEGSTNLNGTLRYTTSALDGLGSTVRTDEVVENRHNPEISLGGPFPFSKGLLPGELRFFLTGYYLNSDGRFVNQDQETASFRGTLTYRFTPSMKLNFKSLIFKRKRDYFDDLDEYGAMWKVPTVEDLNEKYRPFGDSDHNGLDDNASYIIDPLTGEWYGNNFLDTEDKNGNNFLDAGEDLNGNGVLDREDLDYNGKLDVFNMLDHLADIQEESNQFALTWTHNISPKTYYEVHLDRYYTNYFQNAKEVINEDRDGDGKLDNISENVDLNGDGTIDPDEWLDFDHDGYFDRVAEDLNGNGKLDPYGTDLFTDWDNDGYVDASQDAYSDDQDKWMSTSEIPYKGEKNTDGFYSYGSGLTWDRGYWYVDRSVNYGLKFDLESQVTKNHNIKTGCDLKYREIFRYDATDRYGYGEKFRVFPNSGALYAQDKMEFEGMILNIGMRWDYFNANWGKYPHNLYDPTWSTEDEGFEDTNGNGKLDSGEDTNGNGYLDQGWNEDIYNFEGAPQIGDIKDPRTISFKHYFSPRFGISFPITETSKLRFSYGTYFQEPLGRLLFRNLEFDLGGGFPIIGNPNLEPERTTAYEVGVERGLSNNMVVELIAFYKDVTGQTDSKPIYFTVRDWYGFYYNNDYGNTRGFEFKFTRRPSPLGFLHVGAFMNYSYIVAKNKSSETSQGYLTEWAGNILPRLESYQQWDQRHTMNANVNLLVPRNQDLFGISIFNELGANVTFYYGSGTRWTPPKGQDKAALDNTKTLPWVMRFDLKVYKRFQIGRITPQIFIDIRNVFDRENIIAVADEEWYFAKNDPQGKYGNPTVYERGRLMRLGFRIDF